MRTKEDIETSLSLIIDHADLNKDIYMRGYYNALIWVIESNMYFETIEEYVINNNDKSLSNQDGIV